jgi:ABC-type uncharacterized transport system permease subunit
MRAGTSSRSQPGTGTLRLTAMALSALLLGCAAAFAAGLQQNWQTEWTAPLQGSFTGVAVPVPLRGGGELAAVSYNAGFVGTLDAAGKSVWLRHVRDRLFHAP